MFWKSHIDLTPTLCAHLKLYCPYARHKFVWSKFHSANKRKFQFTCDYETKGKNGRIDILSFAPPKDSKQLQTRKIPKEFFENRFGKFEIRFATRELQDALIAERLFKEEMERAKPDYCIIEDVSLPHMVNYYKPKWKKWVTYNYYIITGEIGMNPSFFYHAYKYGFGENKADGFGMMMIEPISIENLVENSVDKEHEIVV